MKRKLATAGTLRLSPNEEAMFLKEESERRRKLRLQQVREQQKYISYQIRQKVKQRREEQLHQLEEALRAEWQKAQDEKMKALEELYLSSLRAIGEGHRQAKENEPDLKALAKQAEERKQRAEMRHRKALIEQKHQKEKLLREQARRADTRKRALEVERQRAAKVASLPPPPPRPFESFEVKKILAVKPCGAGNFSVTCYHIAEALVDREVDGEQPDAHLAAEEEGRRLEELHREAERERRKQLEKAHIRGNHALKKMQLAKDRERFLEELEQMHAQDRMRRRQVVAQMPPQVSVPPCKRMEVKEEWQRELESAFEEMCSEDRNMKGDLILQFEPQPLPAPSDRAQDNDLDISLEHESACDTQPELPCDTQQESGHVIEEEVPNEPERHEEGKTCQPRSKLALKKLLNKIRSQKEEWTSKSEKESQSEFETIESGTIASEKRPLYGLELNKEQQKNTMSEAKDSMKMLENAVADDKSVPIHPQEQAAKIRMEEERQKWNEEIEKQKQEQLALIKKIEEEKALLEADYLKIQMQTCLEQAKKKKEEEDESQLVQSHSLHSTDQQNQMEHETGNVSESRNPGEDSHRQMIHNFQQRLLQQKRLHKQTIEEARKNLQEYQNTLRQRYLSASETPLSTRETKPINLESVSEPLLQMQGAQSAEYQALEQVHAQEYARSLPVFSGMLGMLEKPSSQKQQEDVRNICAGKSVHFSEASELKHGGFHLPCDCASQEQVGIFETANNHIREPFQSHLPSGSVRKEVTAVRTQPEAQQQHLRFVLPAESSSESSETVHSKELPQKISNYRNKTEAGEEHPFKKSVMPATRRSALADPLAYQQGSVESSSKTNPDQPLNLSESTILVHEESKAQGVEEFLMSKAEDASSLNYSGILSLRDRVLASSESIQAQQKYLKELQEQLDAQREALLSKQRIQEKLLLQKQGKLKEQMQRQQEALKDLLKKQVRHMCPNEKMTEAQKPVRIKRTDFFQVSENYQQENCGRNKFHGSETISQCIGPVEQTEQPEKVLCREQKWRSSKPPVTKVKLGLGLEQHELSIIPEVDTPKSCNLSLAGVLNPYKTDDGTRETAQISTSGEFACVKHHSHALHEGIFPSGITSYEGKASNGSPRQTNPPGRLLQELLRMAAETSCESAQSQDSQVSQDSPVVAAEGGERLRASSGPSLRLDNTEVPSSEAFMQGRPCDVASTVSTGTFSTSEMLNASPADTGLSSDSREDGILRETGSHPWNSSLPFTLQQRQEILSGVCESQLSEGEKYFYRENQIQQILGRPTGNLSSYSEDNTHFQALATELCFPEMEGPFPNFHHQIFQPLEASVDFDTSSSSSCCSQYRISQHSREFSKTSEFSTESPDVSAFVEEKNSGLNGQRSSLPSNLEANGQNVSSEEALVRENVAPGSEESFHTLQLESTLSDDCQNADQPGDMNIVSQRPFEHVPGIKNRGNESCASPASGYEELSRSIGCINLQGSVEVLQNNSLIHLEEQKSYYQLDPIPVTMDETFPQQLIKETVPSEKLPLEAFDKKKDEKLPEKSVHVDEVNKAVELHSQCNMDKEEPDQSFPEGQESLRVLRETNLEDSDIRLHPVVQQNSSLFQGHEKYSHPVPRSSCHIPVWETESGHGIMEEPELTLVSSNDISIVESDIEHPNQEKIKEDAMDNSTCVDQSECNVYTEEREFLPLTPDADDSAFIRPDSSPKAQSPNKSHSPSHQTAVMVLEFAATPESLQKAFLKRKQNFIQESLKRVEAIKNKERENEKLRARKLLGGKSEVLRSRQKSGLLSGKNGALANHLKKVGEVKVSSPEDRKSGEIEMHQRTSRLYNQLAEVKIRNEEKTRQETYAKNREKAKEFQKKMLEKLRAKKTWKAP